MAFKYACFISYPHSTSEMMKEFVDELKKALNDELATIFDETPFVDSDELGGGDHFNETLARALCQSFCMIVVYVPKYERHNFCVREFRAMEILEGRRIAVAGESKFGNKGIIVPIVLRGGDDLPEDIKKNIHYLDFSKYTTASANIRKNEEYVLQIKKLAERMGQLYRDLEGLELCKDCDQFSLPDENEVKPFRRAGSPPANPYPPGTKDAK
jgi:TIR domain